MISWLYTTPYLMFIKFYMKTPQIKSINSELHTFKYYFK